MKNNSIENRKKSSSLMIFITCMSLFILVCYFSISLNNKGTYSAEKCSELKKTTYANAQKCMESCSGSCNGATCEYTVTVDCPNSNPSSSSSSSNYFETCCSNNGMYASKSSCESATNRKCKASAGNACGGGCYTKTNEGLNCAGNTATKELCEANTPYSCSQKESNGCWYTTGGYADQAACHSAGFHCTTDSSGKLVPTYKCFSSQGTCQNETGKICQLYSGCGYVGNGADLGGGVNCTTGDTTGKCGDQTITVCTISGSHSCKDSAGNSHTYTCSHDSGSQTGPDGSYSTCTLSSTTSVEGCYRANNKLQWFTKAPGSPWTKVSVAKANCSGCVSGYVENNDGDCVAKPSGSTPSNPSSSQPSNKPTPSSNPSSSQPSNEPRPSSSEQNVEENPQTGTIAVAIAWFVGIFAIASSFVYFKKLKEN